MHPRGLGENGFSKVLGGGACGACGAWYLLLVAEELSSVVLKVVGAVMDCSSSYDLPIAPKP